ncbi:MAG: MoxR family ATPase [Lentisphaeria bacterium]|nr:MoxR family ATPase [Lentisphaeria bacterium]
MTDKEKAFENYQAEIVRVKYELSQVIVGQKEVIDEIFVSLLCNAHCFIVGYPGLAKTLVVKTLGTVLGLSFKRIQFTPDLMPSDITGTDIVQEDPQTGKRSFEFLKGPLFTHILLADEINRTPPKTQAALLEAMQERQVTVGTHTYELDSPFFVLATQNPLEQEGTYPMPEAQLDRFMMQIQVNYPDQLDELEILKKTTAGQDANVSAVLDKQKIEEIQLYVRDMPVGDQVFNYALQLCRSSRPQNEDCSEQIRDWVELGVGPRAGQYLVLGAKARAFIQGRNHPTTDDIKAIVKPIMRHRLVLSFEAESEEVSVEAVIDRIIEDTDLRLKL